VTTPSGKPPGSPASDAAPVEPEPRRAGAGLALWLTLLLLVAYPLSVGPAVWLAERNVVPKKAVEVVYAPLEALAEHSQFAGRFLDWYVGLFWSPPPK
jgi:hypothetical protein